MKKHILTLVGVMAALVTMSSVQAADVDVAKLKMKITSKINKNNYAFCLGHNCYPLAQVGKVIPMDVGKMDSVITTDMVSMAMYAQVAPDSCRMTVAANDTVVVTGQLVTDGRGVEIANLHCSLKHG